MMLGDRVKLAKDRFFAGETGTISDPDGLGWEEDDSVWVSWDHEGKQQTIIQGEGFKAILSSEWVEKDRLEKI